MLQLKAEWKLLPGASRIHPRRSGHVAFVSEEDEDNNKNNNNNKNSRLLIFGGYVEEDDDKTANTVVVVGSDGSSSKAQPPAKKRHVTQDLWEWQSPSTTTTSVGAAASASSASASAAATTGSSDKNSSTGAGGISGSSSSSSSNFGWIRVQHPSGDIPGPRLVSAGAVIAKTKKAYLFGGWDPQTQGTGGIILDDVHELDLTTFRWKRSHKDVSFPDGPTSRHVAVALAATTATKTTTTNDDNKNKDDNDDDNDQRILIHNHRCLGHVWIFDTKTGTFIKQPTQGPHPTSRGLHAATRVNDHQVVLFGGAAQDGTMSNEVYILDTKLWKWSLLKPRGNHAIPTPRAAPCLCTYSPNCVILFGGAEASSTMGLVPRGDVWALHLDQAKWELLIDDDNNNNKGDDDGGTVVRPRPRNAATLSPISWPNQDEHHYQKTFLLTGGWAPFRETWDDCFVLQVTNEK